MNTLKLITAWDTLLLGSQWLYLEGLKFFPQRRVGKKNGRHLALFAWALPPNSNAGVYRPLSFIRYGTELGWRIDAFQGEVPTNQNEHGNELLSHVPANAKLYIVPSSPRQPSYRLFPQIDGGFKNALTDARYAIQLLAKDPPDIVLASGPPFHVFLAAYFVAKRFGVPLVLDYRDEWTECPFDFVSKGNQDRFWERRCLAAATAVLFTTQSHLEHQLAQFAELKKEKAHLIPNGWESDDFLINDNQNDIQKSANNGILNLAHIGNLASHTLPDDFLKALAELLTNEPEWQKRIIVNFIGRRSPAATSVLDSFPYRDNLKLINHVGKREANRLMQEADVLLLIAAPELERYLPGKLFDYVAAHRPILIFGSPGESSRVLEKIGVGSLCPSGSGKLLGEALQLLWKTDIRKNSTILQKWLDHHKRANLAKEAFDIFSKLVTK